MTALTDAAQRARDIQAHRDLADFMDAHPTVPLPNIGGHEYLILGRTDDQAMAEVDRIAAELGVTPHWDKGRYEARRFFGDHLAYEAVCIPFSVPMTAERTAA